MNATIFIAHEGYCVMGATPMIEIHQREMCNYIIFGKLGQVRQWPMHLYSDRQLPCHLHVLKQGRLLCEQVQVTVKKTYEEWKNHRFCLSECWPLSEDYSLFSDRLHSSNTVLSDLNIQGTCAIFV